MLAPMRLNAIPILPTTLDRKGYRIQTVGNRHKGDHSKGMKTAKVEDAINRSLTTPLILLILCIP